MKILEKKKLPFGEAGWSYAERFFSSGLLTLVQFALIFLDFYRYPRYICDSNSIFKEKGMKEARQDKSSTRMIHVRIPEDLHKRLRVSAAENDITMQNWVTAAIQNELDRREEKGNMRPGIRNPNKEV